MKSSIRPIAIITISLFGFFLIVTHYTNKSDLKYSGREMLEIVQTQNYMVDSDSLSKMDQVQFIDVRETNSFLTSNSKDAINIPLSSLLDEANRDYFEGNNTKVILSDDMANAHEAWMLLTQLGYKNLWVLKNAVD